MMEITASVLAAQPFLRGMPAHQADVLGSAASAVLFPSGCRMFEDGGYAGRFWLLQSGCSIGPDGT